MSTFYVFLSFSHLSSYLPNNKATIKKLLLRKRLPPSGLNKQLSSAVLQGLHPGERGWGRVPMPQERVGCSVKCPQEDVPQPQTCRGELHQDQQAEGEGRFGRVGEVREEFKNCEHLHCPVNKRSSPSVCEIIKLTIQFHFKPKSSECV